jgi:hypothetical protein
VATLVRAGLAVATAKAATTTIPIVFATGDGPTTVIGTSQQASIASIAPTARPKASAVRPDRAGS